MKKSLSVGVIRALIIAFIAYVLIAYYGIIRGSSEAKAQDAGQYTAMKISWSAPHLDGCNPMRQDDCILDQAQVNRIKWYTVEYNENDGGWQQLADTSEYELYVAFSNKGWSLQDKICVRIRANSTEDKSLWSDQDCVVITAIETSTDLDKPSNLEIILVK